MKQQSGALRNAPAASHGTSSTSGISWAKGASEFPTHQKAIRRHLGHPRESAAPPKQMPKQIIPDSSWIERCSGPKAAFKARTIRKTSAPFRPTCRDPSTHPHLQTWIYVKSSSAIKRANLLARPFITALRQTPQQNEQNGALVREAKCWATKLLGSGTNAADSICAIARRAGLWDPGGWKAWRALISTAPSAVWRLPARPAALAAGLGTYNYSGTAEIRIATW